MALPSAGKWSLGSFGAGVLAAAAFRVLARPLLVRLLSFAYGLPHALESAWRTASSGTASIRDEARARYAARRMAAELRCLRWEIGELRSLLDQDPPAAERSE